ncbi:hypothetical protein C8R41DRAFT_828150 [Lentinula lateritia]|uniref:Uncharacterized protein n=1 Tax=Lentinula lateritia TaxID=40482 RepID=A0ABQ8VIL1_9AGAR|nr:hypothetical protein C8R41DRAFT_828150 [Lentinula lateritia]
MCQLLFAPPFPIPLLIYLPLICISYDIHFPKLLLSALSSFLALTLNCIKFFVVF